MQERAFENPKIEIVWWSEVVEALGGEGLERIRVKNVQSGEINELEVAGLFFAIGHKPNTDFLGGQLDVDETGYLVTKPGTVDTNVPGVFAAGDVQDKRWRQAVTAAGSGCMAALSAEHFLVTHPL
jgi:thioredoxin reductase (NADPH)